MEYLYKRQKLYVGVKFWSDFGLEMAVSLHACVVLVGFWLGSGSFFTCVRSFGRFCYCAVKACVEYDGEV